MLLKFFSFKKHRKYIFLKIWMYYFKTFNSLLNEVTGVPRSEREGLLQGKHAFALTVELDPPPLPPAPEMNPQ